MLSLKTIPLSAVESGRAPSSTVTGPSPARLSARPCSGLHVSFTESLSPPWWSRTRLRGPNGSFAGSSATFSTFVLASISLTFQHYMRYLGCKGVSLRTLIRGSTMRPTTPVQPDSWLRWGRYRHLVRPQETQTAAAAPDRLIYAEDVAEKIGMTAQWVYDQSRRGLIPHVKLGRFYRYRASSIDNWLRSIERGARCAA